MSTTLKRVKLLKLKDGHGLILTLEKKVGGDDVESNERHKAPIHPDLKKCFDELAIHLAVMTGYVASSRVTDIAMPDPELSEKFYVHAYSMGGDDDSAGVVVSGHHILPNGKAVILNTPFYRLEESPETRYIFMDDLVARLTNAEKEITDYLKGKKRGGQQALDLPAPSENGKANTYPQGESHASPEAQERIMADGDENKTGTKRRNRRQTADNPSGEAAN